MSPNTMLTNHSSCLSHVARAMQHSHWLTRDNHAPLTIHIMVGLFIITVGMVAVVGNVLVVVTCVRYKDLRTRSNILIINLAVGDLLMCVIDFPLLAIASFLQGWPFGFIVCRMYAFLTAVAGLVTINTLGVISADRYWAVVWRASPRQQLPKYVTGLIVLGVWLYAISWSICPILGWGDYVLDGIGTTCTFDYLTRSWTNRSFVIAMVMGNFVVPFVMMLFSYTRIWLAVCDAKRGLKEHQGRAVAGKNNNNNKKTGNRKCSMTSDVKADYSSAGSDLEGVRRLYKVSNGKDKTLDVILRSKTFLQEDASDGNKCVYVPKDDEKMRVMVNPHKSKHKDYIIFSFKKQFPAVNENEKESNNLITVRENGIGHQQHQYEKYSCKGVDDVTKTEMRHSCDNGQSKHHQYVIVRNPRSSTFRKESTSSSSRMSGYGESENRKSARISLSYYQKAISDKLFLKQHRYRLHCEYKTMKIIMFLLLAFVISWFPYVVVSMMGLFGDASRINYLTSVFPSLLAKTSMVFNPILYSISHPKVRKRILHLFFCCSRHRHNNNNTGGNSGLRPFNAPFSSSLSYSR